VVAKFDVWMFQKIEENLNGLFLFRIGLL